MEFEESLMRIQRGLTLPNQFRKVWVQGNSQPGRTKLCITLFSKDNYEMRFLELKNFSKKAESTPMYINQIQELINTIKSYK